MPIGLTMDLNLADISNICRICLNTNIELVNLFNNDKNNLSLGYMLNECIQMKVFL